MSPRVVRPALLAALVCALAPAAAHADPPPSRPAMVALLSGFEHEPGVDEVRAWGPQGAATLVAIADDATEATHVRVRAAHSLRAFPEIASVRTFLRRFAAAPGQGLFLVRAALDALVVGFGDVAEVARHLRASTRPDVREGAAWSLARSRDPAARAALRDALRTERDPAVRATIETALQSAPPAR